MGMTDPLPGPGPHPSRKPIRGTPTDRNTASETPKTEAASMRTQQGYEESGDDGGAKWAQENYQHAFWSTLTRGSTLPLDIAKIFLPEDSVSNTTLSFVSDLLSRFGAREQYKIYGNNEIRDDLWSDEQGTGKQDKRPAAAAVGHVANFLAQYINPILPVTRLIFDKPIVDGIKVLSQTPLDIYWRARAFCFGEFNLKKTYDVVKQGLTDFRSTNLEKSEKARRAILDCIKPVLGGAGFFIMTAAAPFKILNKFMGEKSKLVDFIYSLAFSTQHLLYYVNYTTMDLSLSRFAKSQVTNDPNDANNQANERKASAFSKLFYLGAVTNAVNFLTPVLSLMKSDEDSIFGKTTNFLQSTQLTGIYFALRRYLRGKFSMEELGLSEGPNGRKDRQPSLYSNLANGPQFSVNDV